MPTGACAYGHTCTVLRWRRKPCTSRCVAASFNGILKRRARNDACTNATSASTRRGSTTAIASVAAYRWIQGAAGRGRGLRRRGEAHRRDGGGIRHGDAGDGAAQAPAAAPARGARRRHRGTCSASRRGSRAPGRAGTCCPADRSPVAAAATCSSAAMRVSVSEADNSAQRRVATRSGPLPVERCHHRQQGQAQAALGFAARSTGARQRRAGEQRIGREVPRQQRPHRRRQHVDDLVAAEQVDAETADQAEQRRQQHPAPAPRRTRQPTLHVTVARLAAVAARGGARSEQALGRRIGRQRLRGQLGGPGRVFARPQRRVGGIEGLHQDDGARSGFVHERGRAAAADQGRAVRDEANRSAVSPRGTPRGGTVKAARAPSRWPRRRRCTAPPRPSSGCASSAHRAA